MISNNTYFKPYIMHITKQTIIGQFVAQQYLTASIVKESGIDFCCNGNRAIQEACDQQQIESEVLIVLLESLKNQTQANRLITIPGR